VAGILTDRRLIGLRSDVGAFDGESSAGNGAPLRRRSELPPARASRRIPSYSTVAKRVTLWAASNRRAWHSGTRTLRSLGEGKDNSRYRTWMLEHEERLMDLSGFLLKMGLQRQRI